jgi:hypothetical protein
MSDLMDWEPREGRETAGLHRDRSRRPLDTSLQATVWIYHRSARLESSKTRSETVGVKSEPDRTAHHSGLDADHSVQEICVGELAFAEEGAEKASGGDMLDSIHTLELVDVLGYLAKRQHVHRKTTVGSGLICCQSSPQLPLTTSQLYHSFRTRSTSAPPLPLMLALVLLHFTSLT